jgi:prepilin-type N-terminal cleavage/methylation domain-containing protein/prepilin-type processing-associated H-X9-DG protein
MTSRRRGFTLIELLVVIAIIGVLIALLLPAVQSAREAARRAQCTNNLKQIGLAIHNYHDAFRVFPTHLPYRGAQQVRANPCGWLARILPYLEQEAAHDQMNFALMDAPFTSPVFVDAKNATAFNVMQRAFMCPSDATQQGCTYLPLVNTGGVGGNVTCTNYFGVMASPFTGTTPRHGFFQSFISPVGSGVAVDPEPRSLKHCVDGTSHSLFALERTAFAGVDEGSIVFTAGSPYFLGFDPETAGGAAGGAGPLFAGTTMFLICATTACPMYGINPVRNADLPKIWPLLYSSSFHPSGANGLYADGSATFLSDSIDQKTLDALTTIDLLDNVGL